MAKINVAEKLVERLDEVIEEIQRIEKNNIFNLGSCFKRHVKTLVSIKEQFEEDKDEEKLIKEIKSQTEKLQKDLLGHIEGITFQINNGRKQVVDLFTCVNDIEKINKKISNRFVEFAMITEEYTRPINVKIGLGAGTHENENKEQKE